MYIILFLFLELIFYSHCYSATVIFEDSFVGSAGTDISGRTPDTTGSSWTRVNSSTGDLKISTSGVGINASAVDSAANSLYTAEATYGSANYEVEATYSTFNSTGATRTMHLVCRFQDNNNFYLAWIEQGPGSNDIRIYSVVSGSATQLSGSEDTNPTASDVFTFICDGNQLSLKKNGTNVINPITNSSITSAGKAGIAVGDFTGVTGAASGGTGIIMDLFKVTDLGGGSPPPDTSAARRRHG